MSASVAVTDKDRKDATDAEKTPLTKDATDATVAAPAEGIDVNKFLENSLKIRLPLMNKDGEFVAPPRVKRAKGSNKRAKKSASADVENQMPLSKKMNSPDLKEKASAYYDLGKQHALDATSDCLPGGVGIPEKPTTASLVALAKKYGPDLVTNAVYAGVALILACVGSGQETVEGAEAEAAQVQAQAEGEINAAQNRLLQYWVIIMGAVSGVLITVKSIRYVVKVLFDMLDVIGDKINAGIDVLQKELQEEVTEMLEDIDVGSNRLAQMAQKAAGKTVVSQLARCIDDAQKAIDPVAMLPWAVGGVRRATIVFAAPCVVVIVVKCLISIVEFASAEAEGRRLFAVSNIGSEADKLVSMATNMLINAVFSFLSSNPVVRFLSNTVIRKIQVAVNNFVLAETKENIPGGVDGMQSAIDAISDPSGANLSSLSKVSTRSCETCAQGCCVL